MTKREHKEFEVCLKLLKSMAVQSQQYEFAAMLRDLEKDLTIPVSPWNQDSEDWPRIASLDPFQYYERVQRLIEKYATEKNQEICESNLKPLYEVVYRSVIRQEMISKILGDDQQQ
jgi:hypothetical protein